MQLFALAHLQLLFSELAQLCLLSLVFGVFQLVLVFDGIILLTEDFLLALCSDLFLVGMVQFARELGRVLAQGLDLVADVLELCAGLVEPNGKLGEYFL